MKRAFYVARHGHREDFLGDAVNDEGRQAAARPHDPGLSPTGHQQARELAERVRGLGIRHLFASPFLRTVQTAQPVAEALDLPIYIEHGICEWLNPKWFAGPLDFHTPADLQRDYPRVDPGYISRVRPVYPETDEPTEAWPRVRRTLDLLMSDFEGDLLMIGHGSSCYGAVHTLCGGPQEGLKMRMCSLTRLELDDARGAWSCTLKACVEHLSETEERLQFH